MASARKGQVPVGWNQYCLSETIGGIIKIKNFSRHGKIRKMLAISLYVRFRFTSTHSVLNIPFVAIECDGSKIDQVENGYTNGGVYRYPFSLKFGCYPGYVLQGLDEISCQDNGEWSGQPPSCRGSFVCLFLFLSFDKYHHLLVTF